MVFVEGGVATMLVGVLTRSLNPDPSGHELAVIVVVVVGTAEVVVAVCWAGGKRFCGWACD